MALNLAAEPAAITRNSFGYADGKLLAPWDSKARGSKSMSAYLQKYSPSNWKGDVKRENDVAAYAQYIINKATRANAAGSVSTPEIVELVQEAQQAAATPEAQVFVNKAQEVLP